MTIQNGKQNGTLYEQVLDFARREIEDASSKIDELRRSLHLLEARVEAAKSVYESVAARLNLEDELEEEARIDAYVAVPPSQLPEPPEEPAHRVVQSFPVAERPVQRPEAEMPRTAFSSPAPPKPKMTPNPPPVVSEVPNNNGTSDGFTMDLIRRHLEEREKAAQAVSQAPLRPQPKPQMEAPTPAPVSQPEQPAPTQGGFPGLSEADRALIGEYLRSKREG
jgi:hypothetical protein